MPNDIFHRRTILSIAAGVLAAPRFSIGGPSNVAQPSLGFSQYGMKTLPLDAALKVCAEIGYKHVELSLNAGYDTEPTAFSSESRKVAASMLKELKLGLPCLMVMMSLVADDKSHTQALELIAAASQLGRDLVPDQPPILETILGGSPGKWDQQKAGMADRLNDWVAAAEKAKTVIAIKAHANSAVNSPDRLLWLLDQVKSPAIQVAYDYSHFEMQGIDMEESMRLLLPRTRFIHVKDSQGDAAKFQFLLPGEGRTDYVKYFTLLRQHGYSGPVCVEVSGQVFNKPNYDPVAAAKQCYTTLSAAMKKAFGT
ncbi:MAG: sugar phosphate isomerase/epimerase family protein [Pirellula sp.]